MNRLVAIPLAIIALSFAGCDSASKPETPDPPQDSAATPAFDEIGKENVASKPGGEADSFFTVDVYDPQRDAAKDLENTIELASNSGKRILIEVGGKW